MRRFLVAGVLAAAVLGGVACEPTPPAEPAMTITAKVYDEGGDTPPDLVMCGYDFTIRGVVAPATATKKVVLQQTVGGKWVDVKGWAVGADYYSKSESVRTANVSQSSGAYKIAYLIDWYGSTKHLRVRSNGGTKFSASFYIKPGGWDGPPC